MKKLNISIITVLLIFTIASCYFCSNRKSDNQTNNNALPSIPVYRMDFNQSLQKLKGRNTNIEASYADGASSLEEMKNNSEMIIDGVVESQIQSSSLSVESIVSVKNDIKGKNFDKIKVYQLGTIGYPEVLQINKEYILCLGLQGNPDENKFYIKGGIQGMFLKDNDKITAFDNIMKNDILKLQKGNTGYGNNSQYNSLIQFLSK